VRAPATVGGTVTARFPVAPHDRVQSVPSPAVPGWSENLLAFVFDPAAGLAVWAHWSRVPAAPHVWEAVLSVHLPGGTVLVTRTFAPSTATDTAGGGSLRFACRESHEAWDIAFDGMVRRTSEPALRDAPLADGPHEPLSFDLRFQPIMPTWDAHAGMADQAWATAHLQQAGRVTGRVRTTHGDVAIDAVGFRDHSYGPRDHAALEGDAVCWAAFPSGRAVMALELWQRGGRPPVGLGYVWDGTTLHGARSVLVPRLDALRGGPADVTVTMESDAGPVRLDVAAQSGTWWTFDELVGLERPARVVWDGEAGHGWLEQILRPSALEAHAPAQNPDDTKEETDGT
jgi:hypothetical protein